MRSLILLLLLGGSAFAAAPDVHPVPAPDESKWSEMKAATGRLLVLSAEPASRWLLVDDESGAELRVFDAGKHAVFAAPTTGRFKVIVTGPDGAASKIVIVVGAAPTPPKPIPPDPTDPLKARIKAAIEADAANPTAKAKAVKDLALLYDQLAKKVCPDESIATAGELLERARETAKLLIGADSLLGVRKVVAEELAVILTADVALTQEQRDSVAALFTKLAAILEGESK